MRILQRALPVLSFALLCGHPALTQNSQNNETFSAGAGGTYDASVCNDPRIAETARVLKSTPYHDPTPAGNGVTSPLRAALNVLAQKDMNGQINNASVCLGAPGVVYFVPTNLVGQVTQLLEQEKAGQPGGDTYNGSGNKPSSGQPGGTKQTGGANGGGGGSGGGYNETPKIPGPAGGIGTVTSTADPCLPQGKGGYNYCDNGPGARLPAGCVCQKLQAGIDKNGGDQPAQTTQKPLTAKADDVCAPLSSEGYIYCARGQNGQAPQCACNDTFTLSTSATQDTDCQTFVQQAQKLPKFTPSQVKTLQQILSDAQTMLTKAKAHVDKWDVAAQYWSFWFFGSSDSNTKAQVSQIVNSELSLLKNMSNVEQHVFTDYYAGQKNSPIKSWAAAYVIPYRTPDGYPMVFIPSGFWTEPSDYQVLVMVHELSHLNPAGESKDFAYGPDKCLALAAMGNLSKAVAASNNLLKAIGVGEGGGGLPYSFVAPEQMEDPFGWDIEKLPTPTNVAIYNADSIAYFINQLAQQK